MNITRPINRQTLLDTMKLDRAKLVLAKHPMATIREKSLSNLVRWKARGAWCSAYDEWEQLMRYGSDDEVIAMMTGEDQNANRMRQSSPYVGLLEQQELEGIRAKAAD